MKRCPRCREEFGSIPLYKQHRDSPECRVRATQLRHEEAGRTAMNEKWRPELDAAGIPYVRDVVGWELEAANGFAPKHPDRLRYGLWVPNEVYAVVSVIWHVGMGLHECPELLRLATNPEFQRVVCALDRLVTGLRARRQAIWEAARQFEHGGQDGERADDRAADGGHRDEAVH